MLMLTMHVHARTMYRLHPLQPFPGNDRLHGLSGTLTFLADIPHDDSRMHAFVSARVDHWISEARILCIEEAAPRVIAAKRRQAAT